MRWYARSPSALRESRTDGVLGLIFRMENRALDGQVYRYISPMTILEVNTMEAIAKQEID